MIYLCECASSFIWDNASAPLTNCLVRCHPHCASLENVTVYSDTHIYIIIHQLVTFIKFIACSDDRQRAGAALQTHSNKRLLNIRPKWF